MSNCTPLASGAFMVLNPAPFLRPLALSPYTCMAFFKGTQAPGLMAQEKVLITIPDTLPGLRELGSKFPLSTVPACLLFSWGFSYLSYLILSVGAGSGQG